MEPLSLAGSLPLSEGAGLGWVQTARGLLLHRVACTADGLIGSYRVLAPTEWNFHPGGRWCAVWRRNRQRTRPTCGAVWRWLYSRWTHALATK